MILKSTLTGNRIKKELQAHRCVQRWHNKNKSGGNFGINIYFGKEFNRETDKEITGEYNTEGQITTLRFGTLWDVGYPIPQEHLESLETLFAYIKEVST